MLLETLKAKYITKTAYIRKLPSGKWRVFSGKGKNLGTFDSHQGAKKHLREVEYFKHKDDNKSDDETYSSILRQLNKDEDQEAIESFLSAYKEAFDNFVIMNEEDPAEKALVIAKRVIQ
jgi:hypothetical protein